jgi:hypothetical protein
MGATRYRTGPESAQPTSPRQGSLLPDPWADSTPTNQRAAKPEDIYENPPGNWEINWSEDLNINAGKIVLHKTGLDSVEVTSIYRGDPPHGQPKGTAAQMLADSIKDIAGIQRPTRIRIGRIQNPPTVEVLQQGSAAALTPLGRVLSRTGELFGARVTNWKVGFSDGQSAPYGHWIEVELKYPAPKDTSPPRLNPANGQRSSAGQVESQVLESQPDGSTIKVSPPGTLSASELRQTTALVISGNPRDWGGTHTNTPYPFRTSNVPLKTELNNGYTVSITAPDRTIPGATLTLDLNKLGPGQAYVGKLVSTEPSLAPKIIGRAVQLADAKGQTSVTFHANDARLKTLYERRYGATYLGTENVYGMELYKFKFDLTDPAVRQKYGLPQANAADSPANTGASAVPRGQGGTPNEPQRAAPPSSVQFNADAGRFEASWNNEIVPRVSFTRLSPDGTVAVDYLYRISRVSGDVNPPPGTGGQMLADALRGAGIDTPKKIRIVDIANKPTLDALARGEGASTTVLGNTLNNTVTELNGRVVGWKSGVDGPSYDRRTWIEVEVEYPRESGRAPAASPKPPGAVITDPAVRQQNFDAWFGRGQPQPQEGFIRPDVQRYRTTDGTAIPPELRELLALEGPQPYANASLQGPPSEFVIDGAQPRAVYHGTNKVFYAFERSQTHDSGWLGTGYYFTSDPAQAATYARSRSNSPKIPVAERGEPVVMDAYLSLRKPYVISNNQYFSGKLQSSKTLSAEFGQLLRQQGFDGVVFKNGDRIEYCIFSAPQIKSVTGNRGTYSPTDPDMRGNLPVKWPQYG